MGLTEQEKRQLDVDGYVVLDGFFDGVLLDRLRVAVAEVFAAEGEAAGAEFAQEPGCKRIANAVAKGDVFRDIIGLPRLLDYVRHILGPDFKLSSLNVRLVEPHGGGRQPLHADMAAVADERGYWVCNTVWMLDDFTATNGAVRVVPGSHRLRCLPQDVLAAPLEDHPEQVLVTGCAGTVVVMNAHLWHAGTENRAERPRIAVHAFYCRGDKPQQQYQKQLLSPSLQAFLSADLRQLLALDDLRNDQLSAGPVVRSGFLNYRG